MNYHLSIDLSLMYIIYLSSIYLIYHLPANMSATHPKVTLWFLNTGTWNTIFLSSPAHVSSRPRDSRSRPGPPSSSVLGTPGLVGEKAPTPSPVPPLKLRPGLFHSWHSVQTCFCLSLSVFFSFSRELCENV